jgi:hypothetical protein
MILEFTEQVQAQMALSQQQGQQQNGQMPQNQMSQDQGQAPQQAQGAPAQADPQLQAMAQAAKQVAQMNQQNLQNQLSQQQQGGPKDQAAMMTAQARVHDSQIKAAKTQHDMKFKDDEIQIKKAKLGLEHLGMLHDAHEKKQDRHAQIEQLVATKGLDAMIQGQSHAFVAKQDQSANIQKAQMERANNAHSTELQKQLASHHASLQQPPQNSEE